MSCNPIYRATGNNWLRIPHTQMKPSNDFDKFKSMHRYHGWHGPMPRLPEPPQPGPELKFVARVCWYVREYLRPKSKQERILISLAKKQRD